MNHALCTAAVLFLSLLFSTPASAQSGRIEGAVLEEGIGRPLVGVNVRVEGTALGAATAADGRFAIEDVPAGEYVLAARALGFERARDTVRVEAGRTSEVTFRLLERPIEIAEVVVERVMMTGGRRGIDEIPGSAHYIGPRELETFGYNDIGRILQSVPGVNVQDEDGYGLRPNIGMRGTGVERSSKITVMEDGVLMAPAPYSAPAAYYFPTAGRMQAVEVRKGSSQIKYGPYTTGGALNLISTQIPSTFAGKVDLLAGNDANRLLHAHVGNSFENVGFLVETHLVRTDGFKRLDGGGDTGFDKQDYLAKLRFNTGPGARVYQSITFKASQTDETSEETYLGLTDGDFAATPFRRYAASQEDVMNTEHRQFQARHIVRPTSFLDVTTTLYRTEFARNWYKLDRVRAGAEGDRLGIADVLEAPEANPDAYAIVTGATSPNDNALEVKNNNRAYYAQGVQSVVGLRFDRGGFESDLELGIRYHRDEVDRFQWVNLYRMDSGVMELTERGTPGTESNRVETATALATYAQYRIGLGRLTATPGLRFEHVRLARDDYGKEDPERTGTSLETRRNEVGAWMPGIGLEYQISEPLQAFGGVHRGFAPPGSKEGTEPERSVNYELGARYQAPTLGAQAVAFFNDYGNLLGTDLAAGGGTGSGLLFNGGAVDVRGLELSADYDLGAAFGTRLGFPVELSYTYTDATFENAFESEYEPWGTVEAGDELPYLPRHQGAVQLGFETARFGTSLSARFTSQMRTVAGQGDFIEGRSIDGYFVLDASARYALTPRFQLFATARNLTDEAYAVARRPAGLRPGLSRTFLLGMKTRF